MERLDFFQSYDVEREFRECLRPAEEFEPGCDGAIETLDGNINIGYFGKPGGVEKRTPLPDPKDPEIPGYHGDDGSRIGRSASVEFYQRLPSFRFLSLEISPSLEGRDWNLAIHCFRLVHIGAADNVRHCLARRLKVADRGCLSPFAHPRSRESLPSAALGSTFLA